MIEVYAITDEAGPAVPDTGFMRLVPAGGLAAVCAPARHEEMTPEVLWRHEELVEGLMQHRDVLPVRYGTRVKDEAAAVRAIDARRTELAAALDRVRGAVELSVRVAGLGGPVAQPAPTGGAQYLRAQAGSAALHSEALDAVHAPLAQIARSTALRPPRRSELLRGAYLVDRGAVERFVGRVAALQEERSDLRLLCTGPWPPYTFAEP